MDGNRAAEAAEAIRSKLHNDPDWFCYDALNKVEPLGRQLKPWEEMNGEQRAVIVQCVNGMSLYRAESKVDPNDADMMFESNPELHELLA